MAKSLNKVMLIGNLGRDPEIKYTTNSVAVANFTIATNEVRRDKDGNQTEKTEWHNIVAWSKLAEICEKYLKKGNKVYIEGRLQTRTYDDKNTGQKKYFTEIVADNMIMLDSRGGAGGGGETYQAPASDETPGASAPGSAPADDLPF
jgi:single-strand DNA-binding protein